MSIVKRALGIALGLSLAVMLIADAQAGKTLRWKFKEGENFDYALAVNTNILIEAQGAEFDVANKQVFDIKWAVKAVDGDGAAEVGQTIDRIQLKMNTPFTGEFAWDSKSTEEPSGPIWDNMGAVMKAMVGKEITMKVGANGEISDLKLPEELVKAMSESGGGRMSMMGGGMSEDMVKMMIMRAVTTFPAEAVEADKTWKQDFEMKMGEIGTQKTEAQYTYQGMGSLDGKDLDKIGVKLDTSLELAEDNDSDVEIEITEQDAQGTVYFDSEAGRLIDSKVVQKMTMEGAAMGGEFTQELESTTIFKLGNSDSLPADEEEKEAETTEADTPATDDKKADEK